MKCLKRSLRAIAIAVACVFTVQAQQASDKQYLNIKPAGKRIALVIGNDHYQKVSKLEKAGNDATTMAKELKAAGFEVLLHRDLSYRGMVQAVETLSNSITGGDQVVVFFAGHGVQLRTGNYLLPVDIEANSESEVEKTAYGLDSLTEKISEARASFALIIVDACRDNPLRSRGRNIGGTRGLSAVEPPKGQIVVYSASKGQRALDRLNDSDGHPNGVFTREFIARMNRPGVRIEELVREVQDAVEELARTVSHDQRPAIYNEARGNFYFFGPTVVQSASPSSATGIARPRTAEEIEDIYWDSVKSRNDADALDGYLKAYPKGRYAAQAINLVKLLRADARQPTGQAALSSMPILAVPTKSENPENQFWNEVKASGEKDYLNAYLRQYPKGKYIALAKIELKKLDEQDKARRAKAIAEKQQEAEIQRREAQRAESDAWEEAKARNSVAGYATYLEHYPMGSFATIAQVAMLKLQRDTAEKDAQEGVSTPRQKSSNTQSEDVALRPGTVFKDCADCPEMVMLSGGILDMGEGDSAHRVALKRFALGKTEVTQGQWRAVVGSNPSYFKQCGDDCPVEQVSWNDAQEFVGKLRRKTGKNYRLPSEAEWEYGCRSGGTGKFCGSDEIDGVAWYTSNSGYQTHRVASKRANGWGLHDMNGNVWEWTEDCWHDSYIGAPDDGSAWTSGECGWRVVRGGSWNYSQQSAQATRRNKNDTTIRNNNGGFRLARSVQ